MARVLCSCRNAVGRRDFGVEWDNPRWPPYLQGPRSIFSCSAAQALAGHGEPGPGFGALYLVHPGLVGRHRCTGTKRPGHRCNDAESWPRPGASNDHGYTCSHCDSAADCGEGHCAVASVYICRTPDRASDRGAFGNVSDISVLVRQHLCLVGCTSWAHQGKYERTGAKVRRQVFSEGRTP